MIQLLSEARKPTNFREGKPETVVQGEAPGLRERRADEPVHFALNPGDRCSICSVRVGPEAVWTDSLDRHQAHKARCGMKGWGQ